MTVYYYEFVLYRFLDGPFKHKLMHKVVGQVQILPIARFAIMKWQILYNQLFILGNISLEQKKTKKKKNYFISKQLFIASHTILILLKALGTLHFWALL